MNKFDKIKLFCRKFRIAIGIILILVGFYTGIDWFYLGILPLLAGLTNFCPLCIISKKCTI
ncbi:YgaP family membrane protein [Arcobacter sp.]|uniref:YgaP family membrane protein n=1 Tax=unclassified Arcobacter TaxID=2593671 RepID=UPI003AFFFD32